ncbi:olfactory receptor 1496-like [Discoglossus pictus]
MSSTTHPPEHTFDGEIEQEEHELSMTELRELICTRNAIVNGEQAAGSDSWLARLLRERTKPEACLLMVLTLQVIWDGPFQTVRKLANTSVAVDEQQQMQKVIYMNMLKPYQSQNPQVMGIFLAKGEDSEDGMDLKLMNNESSTKYFHILAFSIHSEHQYLLCIVFFLMYVMGTIGNLMILTVVFMDTRLHTPMYIFLGNLSFIDICFITVTLPKLMDILLSGDNSISFIQCYTQTYFAILFSSAEVFLLSFMAYDRYVAICNPLCYHLIMNKETYILTLLSIWIGVCVNSLFLTGFASGLSFCKSNSIPQFYCDIKALATMSCANTKFHIILFVETILFGLLPFLLSLTSYIQIITSILHIRTMTSKRKAFSTCTSHLAVLITFYGTLVCVYMESPSEHTSKIGKVFSVIYAAVTPILNPLIYSLRNKEVKHALIRIWPPIHVSHWQNKE